VDRHGIRPVTAAGDQRGETDASMMADEMNLLGGEGQGLATGTTQRGWYRLNPGAGKRAGATRDGGTGVPTLAGAGAGVGRSGIGCPILTISTGDATPGVSAAQPSEAARPIAKPAMMIALIKGWMSRDWGE